MFGCLPESVKQQVIRQLENRNFIAAKAIYDTWLRNKPISSSSSVVSHSGYLIERAVSS